MGDTIGQAQSGTGKTATFVVGALQRIDCTRNPKNACQALILAPTRELAFQTQRVALALGDYLKLKCHLCIGGTARRNDVERLREGQPMVVGTPGRIYDLIDKGCLKVDDLC